LDVRLKKIAASDCDDTLKSMNVIEQIRKVPLHDKLLTMEALWEDLVSSEEHVEIPEWHKDILDQ
jgi:hypothetical protein